jgi:hypothetical protein
VTQQTKVPRKPKAPEPFLFLDREIVTKATGDYTYPGVIVSRFHTLKGKARYVVEATGAGYRGMLLAFAAFLKGLDATIEYAARHELAPPEVGAPMLDAIKEMSDKEILNPLRFKRLMHIYASKTPPLRK